MTLLELCEALAAGRHWHTSVLLTVPMLCHCWLQDLCCVNVGQNSVGASSKSSGTRSASSSRKQASHARHRHRSLEGGTCNCGMSGKRSRAFLCNVPAACSEVWLAFPGVREFQQRCRIGPTGICRQISKIDATFSRLSRCAKRSRLLLVLFLLAPSRRG